MVIVYVHLSLTPTTAYPSLQSRLFPQKGLLTEPSRLHSPMQARHTLVLSQMCSDPSAIWPGLWVKSSCISSHSSWLLALPRLPPQSGCLRQFPWKCLRKKRCHSHFQCQCYNLCDSYFSPPAGKWRILCFHRWEPELAQRRKSLFCKPDKPSPIPGPTWCKEGASSTCTSTRCTHT